jgi:hypothetical protein
MAYSTVRYVNRPGSATDDAVQSVLRELDARIREKCANVAITAGHNSAGAWELFSYRVYQSPASFEIDPVVVGVVCTARDESIEIRGDIAGETTGDILYDVPAKNVGKRGVLDAAREVAALLLEQQDLVSGAIVDPKRRVD